MSPACSFPESFDALGVREVSCGEIDLTPSALGRARVEREREGAAHLPGTLDRQPDRPSRNPFG